MANISIIVLNRQGGDMSVKTLLGLVAHLDAEVIYVTPRLDDEVMATDFYPTLIPVECPAGAVGQADRIMGTRSATGEYLLYSDTESFFHPWELSNMTAMLTENTPISLRLHRPKGREVDNTPDMAAMALNAMLAQPHLAASSLLRFPHGLHRDLFRTVDMDALEVPPRFLVQAVLDGRRADTFYRAEDPRSDGAQDHSALIASYLDAIDELLQKRGPRGGFTDFDRQRDPWRFAIPGRPQP